MATKIKDQTTAQNAALKLNEGIAIQEKPGEPPAPKEPTTTEKLFPDFVTDDGGIVNRPIRDKNAPKATEPLPAAVTQQPPTKPQTPSIETPTAPLYLKNEEMKGKMVKTVVDGVEKDVPAEEVLKSYQLERHLNAQMIKLAQERTAFEEERKRLMTQVPPAVQSLGSKKDDKPVSKTPEVEALEAQLRAMQDQFSGLRQMMRPAIQEAGIKRVEQMAKAQLGTEDFRQYFDKIRDQAMAELAKPENATNPQAQAFFDSDTFYLQTYKDMKLRELIAKPSVPDVSSPNPRQPVLQTQSGAPVVVTNDGRAVSMPSLEPSGGVPSRMTSDASWQATSRQLFDRARQSGSQGDWLAYLQHKTRNGAE